MDRELRSDNVPTILNEVFEVEQLHRMAAEKLTRLQDDARRRIYRPTQFAEALTVVESLPLTQEEFGLTFTRLHNAQHYVLRGEWGAGGYELLLASQTIKGATFC